MRFGAEDTCSTVDELYSLYNLPLRKYSMASPHRNLNQLQIEGPSKTIQNILTL